MNGGQDLGGMHGLGPIAPEPEDEEPVFHAEWERRVFALTLATGVLGRWNIDMSRHARERQHPADYLKNSYYENWLAGLERLLIESGLASAEELASGKPSGPIDPALRTRVPDARALQALTARPGSYAIDIDSPPRFRIGERVRAANRHPRGHTREPGYTRNRVGEIYTHHGAHVFPDLNAGGRKEGRHLYGVRFAASELWGSAGGNGTVHVDLFEDYLEPLG